MHKPRTAVSAAGLLTVITVFCSFSGAGDQTPTLIDAVKHNELETVKILLSNGVDVNSKDTDGSTALIWASSKGNAEIVKALLAHRADVNAKDNKGWTALWWASFKGHAEVAKVLLAQGADVNGALYMASEMNHPEVAELLKAHGAKETGLFTSLSDWLVIAVLLLITFVLFLFYRIAKTRRMRSASFLLGLAVCVLGPWFLTPDKLWLFGFLFVSMAISDLIALSILRRRVIPPCVRVKRPAKSLIGMTIPSFLCIAFATYLVVTARSQSFDFAFFWGLLTAIAIFNLILFLSEKVKICGNGIWSSYGLKLWDEYESFSWKWKTKDSVGLELVSKSSTQWTWGPIIEVIVAPEDYEAVHRLLEANLPDLSK